MQQKKEDLKVKMHEFCWGKIIKQKQFLRKRGACVLQILLHFLVASKLSKNPGNLFVVSDLVG